MLQRPFYYDMMFIAKYLNLNLNLDLEKLICAA